MNEKDSKLRDLSILYDKLLNHLNELSKYTTSIDTVKKNIQVLKEMNDSHVETRNFARELLSYDFSKVSNNIFTKMMFKEINPQTILFTNLVTDYNQRIVQYVEENNNEQLISLIKDINEFNEVAKKQFKPLKTMLNKMIL